MTKTKPLTAHQLVFCALFAALMSVAAYISVPLPLPSAPKLTLINFVLFIIALLFPLKESVLTVMVWFILGLVGVPVYIGGGSGIGYLLWTYGGYTWAFPIVALVLPLIRGKHYNRVWYTICAIIGVLIIDVIGMLYLMYTSNYNLAMGFTMGFLPFIPLDLVKAVVAAQIIPALKRDEQLVSE